jgi:gliding motility-associated-like protein
MYLFKNILVFTILAFANNYLMAQQGCVNFSNRIKYSFPYNGEVYLEHSTKSVNYIVGIISENPPDSANLLAKIYQDSIVWSKKFYSSESKLSFSKPYLLPNGNIIFNSGDFGDTNSCSLTCISANGNPLWAKKLAVNIPTSYLRSGSKLTIGSNAIYFNGFASSFLNDSGFIVIAKLDFNGNILWNRCFGNSRSKIPDTYSPLLLQGDTLISVCNIHYWRSSIEIDSVANVFTKLNANTGVGLSSIRLKTEPNIFIKGITVSESHIFSDNSIGLSGQMAVTIPIFPTKIFPFGGYPFSLILTKNIQKLSATYFTYNNSLNNGFYSQNFYTKINDRKETGYLLIDLNTPSSYFVSIDSNTIIQRSRVFRPHSSGFFLDGSFHFDDDATFYYSFPHNPNLHQTDLEYSRVGKEAQSNTVDCFGRDTLVITPHTFNIVQDTFVWDKQYQNILTSIPSFITTAPFTINQTTICTQTSICDSIKLKGDTQFCSKAIYTFTAFKNSRCQLKVKWVIDTNFIKILSQVNDTTITVQFLQPYKGYIFATLDGCTLKDSLYIEVAAAKTIFSITKDSLLCPSKSLTLQASKGFANYSWQNGSTTDYYNVVDTGFYKVIAKDSCGNTFSDSIHIKFIDTAFAIPQSAIICNTDTFKLKVPVYFNSLTVQPANGANFFNGQLSFFPSQTTTYNITAQTTEKCNKQKSILIQVNNCPANLFFPNAFSPNDIAPNNFFKPFATLPLKQYHLVIYNRYGQKVFESTSPFIGWNGKFNNTPQGIGTYIYYCTYQFFNKDATSQKGYCILLR